MTGIGTAESSAQGDRQSIARRVQRNVGILVGGNIAVAGLGVVTLALNARALGVAGLGVLALIMTIAMLIDRIVAFQTWQPLVKLGADARDVGDKVRIGQLTTVALLFDMGAALVAASVAVSVVLLAGEWLGLPKEYLGVAAIYMATLVTRVADAPAGLLRLFDRFELITVVRVSEAGSQSLAAAVLFVLGSPLTAYVLSFAAIAVATNVTLFTCAWHVAAVNGVSPKTRGIAKSLAESWREFWTFSWAMSITAVIDVTRERGPVLLVGAMVGPIAVGIYHVAERISRVLGMLMWPVHQALFPEAARLVTSGRRADLKWFVWRVGGICGVIGLTALLGALVFGENVLLLVGGPKYELAYWPLVLLICGYFFAMTGIGLRSTIALTVGPKALLKANLVPMALFLLGVIPAIAFYDITGLAAAQALFWLFWLAVIIAQFSQWLGLRDDEHAPVAQNTET